MRTALATKLGLNCMRQLFEDLARRLDLDYFLASARSEWLRPKHREVVGHSPDAAGSLGARRLVSDHD
jgi:hypothetical protein